MKKVLNKKTLIILFLFCVMTINFYSNIFSTKTEVIGGAQFQGFQGDSESLVFSKIDQINYDQNLNYGLSATYVRNDDEKFAQIYKVLPKNINKEDFIIKPYVSQVGFQGYIFSFLHCNLHIPVKLLKLGCCALLSIILMSISILIGKKYNKVLGGTFFMTFLLSPWIIAFARNLYWVEFTWFLPCLFALLISLNYSKKSKRIYIPLIFISILIKCLCGYEYITSIMLLTISFFIIDLFMEKDKLKRKNIFKTIIIVGITCLLAFFSAICIHGYIRGNGNILTGIKDIYEQDVVRRTLNLSGSDKFDGSVYEASLHASVFTVVKKYCYFSTNIIFGFSGDYFRLLAFVASTIVIYNFINKKKNYKRDLVMFITFFITSISWFVLGKAHSYIHTHMNYVLWYFGFIQICLYVIIENIIRGINYIQNHKLKELN